jgi:hypothetical protein
MNALQTSIQNTLTNNSINDVVNVSTGFVSYEMLIDVVFEDASINIVETPNSLTDYFSNITNFNNGASYKFPKSIILWNGTTTYENWKSIQSDYPPTNIYTYEVFPSGGNYNASELINTLNSSFETTSLSFNLPSNSLVFSASQNTYKSSLIFVPFINSESRMYTSSLCNIRDLGYNLLKYDMPLTTANISSDGLININGNEYIFLNCPLFNISISTKNNGNSINSCCFAKLPIGSVPLGHTYFYKNTSDTLLTFSDNGFSDINILNFFLTDQNLEPTINLNGVDWSMTFIIYT